MTLTAALLLGVAALLVGFAKTAIGGVGSLAVAIFAVVLPTKESTAAILLLLIPSVLPGLALGALFLAWVDDTTLRRSIGVLLLVLAALQLGLRWRSPDTARIGSSRALSLGTGVAAGVATMTANAAGPVMTLYLVAQGIEKRQFLGTSALFFLGVNLCKVPFSIGLGLFDGNTLWRTVALAPLVLGGCWIGLHAARRLSQARFDQAVLAATVVSAVALVVR